MRIVVTGNIGSGKSTATQALVQQLPGYTLVSVDALVHELYEKDAQFLATLTARFGTAHRKELAQLVFSDHTARNELAALSIEALGSRMTDVFAKENVIVEFPLFFEYPLWAAHADWVVTLDCPEPVRRERVCTRDGISPALFQQIAATQLPDDVKAALAHRVISTNRGLPDMLTEIDRLAKAILAETLHRRCDKFFGTPAVWPLIKEAYSEPHRGYHTLMHLQELFALFDAMQVIQSRPHGLAIQLAIWFHDFVYHTDANRYPRNEAYSARQMVAIVREHCTSQWLTSMAQQLILASLMVVATKTHTVPEYLNQSPDQAAALALFLDMDLAILAAEPGRLEAYDEGVRQEWNGLSRESRGQFNVGRHAALTALANRAPLFYSEAFRPLEAKARENLEQLKAKYAPATTP